MIAFSTFLGEARIVESESELPTMPRAKRMWLDAETTSMGLHEEAALHPYLGDRACGWSVTWDDVPGAWYVPVRCSAPGAKNLSPEAVARWLADVVAPEDMEWENAGIKFDAHVAVVEGARFGGKLGCLTTRAKLLNSDRFSHELKPLCRDWLDLPMSEETEVENYLAGIGGRKICKDYGRVPVDIIGRYGCMDVLGARMLGNYVRKRLPEECRSVYDMETLLTPVLWDMEHEGLLVDMQRVRIEELKCLKGIIEAQQLVYDELGMDLVDSNNCMQAIMLQQLGLPVLSWQKEKTKSGQRNPCFDKDAMLLYAGHPRVVSDPKTKRIVDAIRDFREQGRFKSLYVDSFKEKVDENGRIHPIYNQCVRTGRMSCRDPNSQQMNARAKALIVPAAGEAIWAADAEQAEFRTIVHVTRDDDAIAAYATNPDTDYHQWVADLCGIKRKPAKTMNFLMAFGGGKKRATKELMSNEDVVAEMSSIADEMIADGRAGRHNRSILLEDLCARKAAEVWEAYHHNLPGIRFTSRRAEKLCKARGYIKNGYGRRRHLSCKAAYKAFNTYVQGTTMDVIKERTAALAPRYNPTTRAFGLRVNANVHDEAMGYGPREAVFDPEAQRHVVATLSDVQREFRVPYTWSLGVSDVNWAGAKKKK